MYTSQHALPALPVPALADTLAELSNSLAAQSAQPAEGLVEALKGIAATSGPSGQLHEAQKLLVSRRDAVKGTPESSWLWK